jgi:hypothetical protein
MLQLDSPGRVGLTASLINAVPVNVNPAKGARSPVVRNHGGPNSLLFPRDGYLEQQRHAQKHLILGISNRKKQNERDQLFPEQRTAGFLGQ